MPTGYRVYLKKLWQSVKLTRASRPWRGRERWGSGRGGAGRNGLTERVRNHRDLGRLSPKMIGLNLRGARRQLLSTSIQSGSTKQEGTKSGDVAASKSADSPPSRPTSGRGQSGASGRGQWWTKEAGVFWDSLTARWEDAAIQHPDDLLGALTKCVGRKAHVLTTQLEDRGAKDGCFVSPSRRRDTAHRGRGVESRRSVPLPRTLVSVVPPGTWHLGQEGKGGESCLLDFGCRAEVCLLMSARGRAMLIAAS